MWLGLKLQPIEFINSDTFWDLGPLQQLYLDGNDIKFIGGKVFEGLHNLQRLQYLWLQKMIASMKISMEVCRI